jgi:hypothetical protein
MININYLLISIIIIDIIIGLSLHKKLREMNATIGDIKNVVMSIKTTLLNEITQLNQVIALQEQLIADGGTMEERQDVLNMLNNINFDISNIIPDPIVSAVDETPVVEPVVETPLVEEVIEDPTDEIEEDI